MTWLLTQSPMVVSVELASSHHCCRQLGGREQVLQGLFKYHASSLVAKAKLGKTPMSRQGHVNGLRWDLNRPQSWLGTFEGLSKQKLYNRAHWEKRGQIVQRPLGRQEGTLHCPVATLHHLTCHKCVAKYQPPAATISRRVIREAFGIL